MFLNHLQDINFAKYCQNYTIDDKTEKVYSKEKPNCSNELIDVFANCAFIVPIDHFDCSKDFWIGSIVSHQNNGHVRQWNDGLDSFCSYKFLNVFFDYKSYFEKDCLQHLIMIF